MKALNADSAVYVADVQVISHLHGLALIRSCSLRKLSRHVMVTRMQMTAMMKVTTMMVHNRKFLVDWLHLLVLVSWHQRMGDSHLLYLVAPPALVIRHRLHLLQLWACQSPVRCLAVAQRSLDLLIWQHLGLVWMISPRNLVGIWHICFFHNF